MSDISATLLSASNTHCLNGGSIMHGCDKRRRKHASRVQVVLSRTFGSAGEDGGVGVRFLMPILDMLNHGGDQTPLLLSDPPMAQDDVRCEQHLCIPNINFWWHIGLQWLPVKVLPSMQTFKELHQGADCCYFALTLILIGS